MYWVQSKFDFNYSLWLGKGFIILTGALWFMAGVISLTNPRTAKNLITRLFREIQPDEFGWLALILGILIYMSAHLSSIEWVLKSLGALGILQGLFLVFLPKKTFKRILKYWIEVSLGIYRLYGVITVLIGAGVVFSIF